MVQRGKVFKGEVIGPKEFSARKVKKKTAECSPQGGKRVNRSKLFTTYGESIAVISSEKGKLLIKR